MLEASRERILATVADDALVLDVGGGAAPFHRADWVLDLLPYDARGSLDSTDPDPPRFSAERWVARDACDREPWPFADGQFDFAVCAQTLEDVRDPVWMCSELQRVARAGYIEVPSRLEEQTYGIQGPWVGWGHHHWLCTTTDNGIEFVFKHHIVEMEGLHRRGPRPEGARFETLWWTGAFTARERIFTEPQELSAWLAEVADEVADRVAPRRARRLLRAMRRAQ